MENSRSCEDQKQFLSTCLPGKYFEWRFLNLLGNIRGDCHCAYHLAHVIKLRANSSDFTPGDLCPGLAVFYLSKDKGSGIRLCACVHS